MFCNIREPLKLIKNLGENHTSAVSDAHLTNYQGVAH